ncbi:acetate uptake transporter [Halomarina salina]|uniref:Acetate uptake transporter n=1 Tax=Halomarina salina TaxID=1872699 RepID=A0ABD5RJ45_9EURY|nr:acetate uptake transporter [Halomarina salina]
MPKETKLANPAPLGLMGFALTTMILSLINAGLLPDEGGIAVVIPLAMAYGGTMQIVAGILAFRKGDTFETMAFNTYGAFWWWFGLAELFAVNGLLSPSTTAIGVTLVGFGVITTILLVGTLRLNWALFAVFATLAATFYLVGVGDWLGIDVLVTAGGYVGMVTAVLAAYTAAAEVLNWTFGEDRIPLGGSPTSGRRTTAQTAD